MSVVKNIPSLQIQTYGQMAKLTRGQHVLLKTITHKVFNKQSMTWDDIVDAYCKGVRDMYTGGNYRETTRMYEYNEVLIKDEYKKQSVCWTYTLRGLIKQWFLLTIGALVIKNQLVVIPLIEIE